MFSFRDDFGQWDPKSQRPELWSLYNGRIRKGEHVRVFPISNWTELDVWQYIASEELEVPSIYFAHEREVFARDGMLYAHNEFVELIDGEEPFAESVRYRTVGDMTCTGAVRSTARDARGRRRRDRRHPDHRARRDPRRRPRHRGGDGGPQARGLLLACAGRLHRTAHARIAYPDQSSCCGSPPPGSVDDGKSTLIGRLLHDTKSIFEDQLEHVVETSERRGDGYVNLALLTDGLRAEREQGITIDVAYRYFQTPRRKFIIADTPGHEQYTRNMVTGASTADLSIVLVDARKGVSEQTRRHAYIASLLRIPHVVVCVNKMDLVDYDEDGLRRDPRGAHRLGGAARRSPTSRSSRSRRCTATTSSTALTAMQWYGGRAAALPPRARRDRARPQPRRRPLPGAVGDPADDPTSTTTTAATPARSPAACCSPGDEVVVLPGGQRTRIAAIDTLRRRARRRRSRRCR